LACLDGLSRVCYPNLTPIVVDNGSTDDSLIRIRSSYPRTTLIGSGGNIGFAAGNNVGIRKAIAAGFDYVWLLNNDTVPDPGSLQELVRKAESDQQFGAVGSVLYYADSPERVQAWGGGRVWTMFGYSKQAVAAQPDDWFDYLTAASILVRSKAVQDVGLLDETFFLYWEDTEFGFRLRRRKWKLGVASASRILHKENGSTSGKTGLRDSYFTSSGIRFLAVVAPLPWLSITLFISLRIVKAFLTGNWKKLAHIARGLRCALTRNKER
jgi:GT2 family glycosyltransferase